MKEGEPKMKEMQWKMEDWQNGQLRNGCYFSRIRSQEEDLRLTMNNDSEILAQCSLGRRKQNELQELLGEKKERLKRAIVT